MIKDIDTFLDGGTKVLQMKDGKEYYVDKFYEYFYSNYPCKFETRINDINQINILIDNIEVYIQRKNNDVNILNRFVLTLKQNLKKQYETNT